MTEYVYVIRPDGHAQYVEFKLPMQVSSLSHKMFREVDARSLTDCYNKYYRVHAGPLWKMPTYQLPNLN